MKKTSFIEGFLAVLIIFVLCLSTAACGEKIIDDDKRPAIYVSVFNGGYGIEWLEKMVKDYNAEHPENKYKMALCQMLG